MSATAEKFTTSEEFDTESGRPVMVSRGGGFDLGTRLKALSEKISFARELSSEMPSFEKYAVSAFFSGPAATAITRMDGRVIHCNGRFSELTGLGKDSAAGIQSVLPDPSAWDRIARGTGLFRVRLSIGRDVFCTSRYARRTGALVVMMFHDDGTLEGGAG